MSETQNLKVEEQQQRRLAKTRRFDAFMAVVIDSITGLFNNNPAQAAAAIAYYSLFSIFPLILFAVIFLSYFLDYNFVEMQLTNMVQHLIPGAEVLITENLQNMLANRTSTSILASVTLLWSGTGMFNCIMNNVQKAFPESNTRGYFVNRALAFVLILAVLALMAGIMTFSVVFNVSDALKSFNIELTYPLQVIINIFSSYILPILFLYIIGFVLYYMIPTAKVDRNAARIAALFFAIVYRAFAGLFGRYILSPMNRYSLIYGSVTVIVLVLLFLYFSAFIILFPAHLAAAITHYKQRRASLLASAPINPEPIKAELPVDKPDDKKEKKKSKGRNKKKGEPVNSRTLSDPVTLDPTLGQKQKFSAKDQAKDIAMSLFRWK